MYIKSEKNEIQKSLTNDLFCLILTVMKTYKVIVLPSSGRLVVWDEAAKKFGLFTTPDGGMTIGSWIQASNQAYWNIWVEHLGEGKIREITTDQMVFHDLPISAAMPAQP